jgi:hypothetical protein
LRATECFDASLSISAELLIKGSWRSVAITAELGAGRGHSGGAGQRWNCDDGEQHESSDELLHGISPSFLQIILKPDWLLPMRLLASKIYSRLSLENSLTTITANENLGKDEGDVVDLEPLPLGI